MARYYRGDVLLVWAPDKNKGLKERPVVVWQDTPKTGNMVSVYCTTQNDGNDSVNIFVPHKSEHGQAMGINQDTYIRPRNIIHIPMVSIIRPLGKCPLMREIAKIIEDQLAGR